MKGGEHDCCKKEKRRKRKLKESQSGQKLILINEDEIISVKNQDSDAVRMKGSEHDCNNKEKRRKTKLKESESSGNLKNRRRNRVEEELEVNTEKLKHVNVVKVDERKTMEATMSEKSDDDMKLGIEDVDEIQSSVAVNDKPTSKLKNKRHANGAELVRGKRFTKEEDDIIQKAVLDYVDEHQLGEQSADMVLTTNRHRHLRGCWKTIAEALPHRPQRSISHRARNIFRRSNRAWTKEETNYIKEMHEQRGAGWGFLAKKLGRYGIQVRDTHRRTKSPNFKNGRWSQDEYQTLFDLVHADLEFKVLSGEKKLSQYGMLKDNIGWEVISDKLGTRQHARCCGKWYHSLSSRMVVDGTWADTDDYRMLIALYKLDASCEEEVEWDNLMEHRTGEFCRKRWKQMVCHIGEHGSKSFVEQVEFLSQRYCSKMLDAREKLDSRPIVD